MPNIKLQGFYNIISVYNLCNFVKSGKVSRDENPRAAELRTGFFFPCTQISTQII